MSVNVSENTRNRKLNPLGLNPPADHSSRKVASAPNSRAASPHPSQGKASSSMGSQDPSNRELLEAIKNASAEQKTAIEELRTEVKAAVTELRADIDQLIEHSDAFKEDIVELRNLNRNQEKKIQDLQKDVNYLQQKEVAHKVLVFGVPRAADPKKAIEQVAKTIKVDIRESDILFCARLKHSYTQPNRPPLILVGFSNHIIAENFVAVQKKFGPVAISQLEGIITAEGEPLTIRTDYFLTNHYMNLLKKAKVTKEELNYKFVWYKHCAIWLKKQEKTLPFRIATAEDLADLV